MTDAQKLEALENLTRVWRNDHDNRVRLARLADDPGDESLCLASATTYYRCIVEAEEILNK